MKDKKMKPWIFILIPFGIVFFLALGGWIVTWLWNALLPGLFGFPEIGFWQALGILALARTLFGGFGSGGSRGPGHRGKHRRHHGGPRGHFTAEERERIRQQLNMEAAPEADGDD